MQRLTKLSLTDEDLYHMIILCLLYMCVSVCVCLSVILVSLEEVTTWHMLEIPTTSGTATMTPAARSATSPLSRHICLLESSE